MKRLLIALCFAITALPVIAQEDDVCPMACPEVKDAIQSGAALTPTTCACLAKCNGARRLDVAVFDHQDGQLIWPAPAKLEVPDEGIFVVVFKNTDSTKFDYSIKSFDADESKTVDLTADGKGVEVTNDHDICVSWQHHEEFPLYRVNITRRVESKVEAKKDTKGALDKAITELAAAGQPEVAESLREENVAFEAAVETESVDDDASAIKKIEDFAGQLHDPVKRQRVIDAAHEDMVTAQQNRLLFPYTFPIWVETSGARLSFSTGLGFSTLTNPRFFLETDTHNTADTKDDTQKVGRDRNGRDSFRPDLMAFATLSAPMQRIKRSWGWMPGRLGITFGLGIGDDSSPRYFLGPSLVLSHRMVISLGAVGAQVKRLPAGQKVGEAPINGANTLNQLDSGFKVGAGLSISLKVGKDQEKFLGVLNPTQKVTETPKPKEAKPADETKPSDKAKPSDKPKPADDPKPPAQP